MADFSYCTLEFMLVYWYSRITFIPNFGYLILYNITHALKIFIFDCYSLFCYLVSFIFELKNFPTDNFDNASDY